MSKGEQAKQNYENGFNCAQSVFAVFAEEYGLKKEQAFMIATCFGGGMRLAATCGALTGAMMALGLAKGCTQPSEENKIKMDQMTYRLIQRWKEEIGEINCKEILGYNITVPDEREAAVESGVIPATCANCIARGAELVQELISEIN